MLKVVDVSPKHKNLYVKISLSTAILVKDEESRKSDPHLSGPVDSMKSRSSHLSPPPNVR